MHAQFVGPMSAWSLYAGYMYNTIHNELIEARESPILIISLRFINIKYIIIYAN